MELSRREEQLRGLTTGWRTMTYNWRDCALYALAVGAGPDEPQYTYEKGMQVIPTFGVTPYWGTVNVTPKLPRPTSVPVLVEEALNPTASYVNLDYEFLYHRPIPAAKGSFVYRDVLTGLFDRGRAGAWRCSPGRRFLTSPGSCYAPTAVLPFSPPWVATAAPPL